MTMEENSSSNSLMMGRVILAFDATKERNDEHEFKKVIDEIISRGDILKRGDTIVVFGVLHKIAHPCKCFYSYIMYFILIN